MLQRQRRAALPPVPPPNMSDGSELSRPANVAKFAKIAAMEEPLLSSLRSEKEAV